MPRRELRWMPDACYHLYNRGNNRGRVFFEDRDYLFFLKQVRKFILPCAELLAYCLMPNHFHLLVRVRPVSTSEVEGPTSEVGCLSRAMMRLLVSYTKKINMNRGRVGALFAGQFQAKHVDVDPYLLHLTRYMHLNPQCAGFVDQAQDWIFSSYQDYLGLREGTLPNPEPVLSQFGSSDEYRAFVTAYHPSDLVLIESYLQCGT